MEDYRALPDTPPLAVLRCPECGQLHLDRSDECMYECDAEMEGVEVVPASQLEGAVDALRGMVDLYRHPDSGRVLVEAGASDADDALIAALAILEGGR